MRLSELMQELEYMQERYEDDDPEVRLAVQPSYPFQHTIEGVYEVTPSGQLEPDAQDFEREEDYEDARDEWERSQDAPDQPVVYIAEGGQLYSAPYLPGAAAEVIGWGGR